jgi:hypothetical protein
MTARQKPADLLVLTGTQQDDAALGGRGRTYAVLWRPLQAKGLPTSFCLVTAFRRRVPHSHVRCE